AVLGDDLEPADLGVVAGRAGEDGADGFAGELARGDGLGRKLLQARLLSRRRRRVDAHVDGRAQLARELRIVPRRVLAGAGEDLGGGEVEDDAVLVGRPGAAVAAQERRPRALLAAEAEAAVEQAVDEVLEADGHLDEAPPELLGDPVDER